jgi:uroporphyrin-III C-methyltransferase
VQWRKLLIHELSIRKDAHYFYSFIPTNIPEMFPTPKGGASLVLSFRLEHKITLIIGGNPLAASRAFSALEAESQVVILSRGPPCAELEWRASQGQILLYDLDSLAGGKRDDTQALETYLSAYEPVSLVCVTDTLSSSPDRRTKTSAADLYRICRKYRIPANITDHPDLCDFSFTSTHRFVHCETGEVTPLQIGVTTNGQGCRLSGRIRREVVSRLPKEVGAATSCVGRLRSLAKSACSEEEVCEESIEDPTPNNPVPQRSSSETTYEGAKRRMKWVAQVSEYWPLSRLANMTNRDIEGILTGESWSEFSGRSALVPKSDIAVSEVASIHDLSLSPPRNGRIFLIGSGPGHPSLLTIAAHDALTQHADLVLSDKLVPTEVLALIPSTVEVQIARKFPGNAEGAQQEMQDTAIEAAKRGLTVVRVCICVPTPLNSMSTFHC